MNISKLILVGLIMGGMTMAAPLPDAPSASNGIMYLTKTNEQA